MKKPSCILILLLLLSFSATACTPAEEAMKITYGTFTMASTDSQIILREDNTLTIMNYDMLDIPPEKRTLTAYNSALIPRKWCMAAGEWCTAAMRSIYSQSPLRFRMESPSILIV